MERRGGEGKGREETRGGGLAVKEGKRVGEGRRRKKSQRKEHGEQERKRQESQG